MIHWHEITADEAAGAVVDGMEGVDPRAIPPDLLTAELCGIGSCALDFGAGVGRNARLLAEGFDTVIAYDLPNMVEVMKAVDLPDNVAPASSWRTVTRHAPYDVTLAHHVFQHMPADEIEAAARRIHRVSNRLVVCGNVVTEYGQVDIHGILAGVFPWWQIVEDDRGERHFAGATWVNGYTAVYS